MASTAAHIYCQTPTTGDLRLNFAATTKRKSGTILSMIARTTLWLAFTATCQNLAGALLEEKCDGLLLIQHHINRGGVQVITANNPVGAPWWPYIQAFSECSWPDDPFFKMCRSKYMERFSEDETKDMSSDGENPFKGVGKRGKDREGHKRLIYEVHELAGLCYKNSYSCKTDWRATIANAGSLRQ